MAKARSPRYPVIGLKEAIDKARLVYNQDYQNKIPKKVVAEHMGYGSLNGKSLGVISAVSKYGLLEGRANEMSVSDRALAIIVHEPGTPERIEAIVEAASEPDLFEELDHKFPAGKASDSAIRSYLLSQLKFLPNAADIAIRAYRETEELVSSETRGYSLEQEIDGGAHEAEIGDLVQWESDGVLQFDTPRRVRDIREHGGAPWVFVEGSEAGIPMDEVTVKTKASAIPEDLRSEPPLLPLGDDRPSAGQRKEVTSLDEGDAVLIWPKELSKESYEDLEAWVEAILRKAARRAGIDRKGKEEQAHE